MQSADVFERFKVFATASKFTVNDLPADKIPDYRERLKRILETEGERVTAILFKDFPEHNYVDNTVKAISDGERWCLLADAIKAIQKSWK